MLFQCKQSVRDKVHQHQETSKDLLTDLFKPQDAVTLTTFTKPSYLPDALFKTGFLLT